MPTPWTHPDRADCCMRIHMVLDYDSECVEVIVVWEEVSECHFMSVCIHSNVVPHQMCLVPAETQTHWIYMDGYICHFWKHKSITLGKI